MPKIIKIFSSRHQAAKQALPRPGFTAERGSPRPAWQPGLPAAPRLPHSPAAAQPTARQHRCSITRRHRRPSRFKGPATAGRQPGRPSAPQRPPHTKTAIRPLQGRIATIAPKGGDYFTTSFNRMSLAARAASAGFFAVALFSCALAATKSPCLAAITARR